MKVNPQKRRFKLRVCPRCSKLHRWPTEDNLCWKCELEWVAECAVKLPEGF